MPDGGLQGDAASQGIAKDVGLLEPEVFDQSGNIVRHVLEGQWAINVAGVSMSLQLNGDDLPILGKAWQKLLEHADYASRREAESAVVPYHESHSTS